MATHMICQYCGSTDVYADATARWSPEKDEWVISCVHDDRYCDQCGGEANLIEVDDSLDVIIEFYGMLETAEEYRPAESTEIPHHFNVAVAAEQTYHRDAAYIYEFENLPKDVGRKFVDTLSAIYPEADIVFKLGKESGLPTADDFYDIMLNTINESAGDDESKCTKEDIIEWFKAMDIVHGQYGYDWSAEGAKAFAAKFLSTEKGE